MPNNFEALLKQIPHYAEDIKVNLAKIFLSVPNPNLTQQELYAISLSIAYILRDETLLKTIRSEAKIVLDDTDANDCKIAAVLMAMNNSFYNFKDNSDNEEIQLKESGLVMKAISRPENQKRFEMSCLAVSIVNKCNYCIKVHEKKLLHKNVTPDTILEIGRIASCLVAVATALAMERMRTYDFVLREVSIED